MVVVVNCVYHCEKVAKTKSYGVWLASKTNKHPFQKLKRKKKKKTETGISHFTSSLCAYTYGWDSILCCNIYYSNESTV